MDVKEEQFMKASYPIDVTLSGMMTDVKEELFWNAPLSMKVTGILRCSFGITISVFLSDSFFRKPLIE